MQENTTKMSVIIVSYNCLPYIKNCLSSIKKYNDIGNRLEVIVVDNSSNNDTVNWITENEKDIVIIKNDNKGFGQANNIGANVATGDVLLFLNPDTIVIEPVFQFAINVFSTNPDVGLFGVQLVDEYKKYNSSYGLRMPMGLFRTWMCNILVRLKVFIPSLMYTSGADLFIRKEVFDVAGQFDENIFMYCEEADLCNRINQLGKKISFFPNKCIIHLEGKTQKESLYSTYRKQMLSRKYYCEKYGINFWKYARKEKRYCQLKAFIYSFMKQDICSEYRRIVAFWQSAMTSNNIG